MFHPSTNGHAPGGNELRAPRVELADPVNRVRTARPRPKLKAARDLTAQEMATHAQLTEIILRDIADIGLVGERENGLLTYVIFTSRLLSDPGNIVTRGRSGGGKTQL